MIPYVCIRIPGELERFLPICYTIIRTSLSVIDVIAIPLTTSSLNATGLKTFISSFPVNESVCRAIWFLNGYYVQRKPFLDASAVYVLLVLDSILSSILIVSLFMFA